MNLIKYSGNGRNFSWQVNLGSIPLCCIAGFSWTKLNLTPTTFTMVRRCNNGGQGDF